MKMEISMEVSSFIVLFIIVIEIRTIKYNYIYNTITNMNIFFLNATHMKASNAEKSSTFFSSFPIFLLSSAKN